MFTLLLFATAVIGFLGGSIWLFSTAVLLLAIKVYPFTLVVLALAGIGLLALKYRWRE